MVNMSNRKKTKFPVVVEFTSLHKKISLFKNKDNLKKLKEKSIFKVKDLYNEDREIQKKLKTHLK